MPNCLMQTESVCLSIKIVSGIPLRSTPDTILIVRQQKNMKELDSRFVDLLSRLRSLDWHDGSDRAEFMLTDTRELIEHGEPGVALENLCQNLYEFSVSISQEDLEEIKTLAQVMQMPDDTWDFLKEIKA